MDLELHNYYQNGRGTEEHITPSRTSRVLSMPSISSMAEGAMESNRSSFQSRVRQFCSSLEFGSLLCFAGLLRRRPSEICPIAHCKSTQKFFRDASNCSLSLRLKDV
jgi:hypothetical protein